MADVKVDLELRKLAESIARNLFTNGFGQPAERLRLNDAAGRYLGGWSEPAVANRIYEALREAGKEGK